MRYVVRYTEIILKSSYVRDKFEKALMDNIRWRFKKEGADCRVFREWARIYVDSDDKRAPNILKEIFGIYSFSPVVSCRTDMDEIEKTAASIWTPKNEFAVRVKRPYKGFQLNTPQIEKRIGALLQKKTGASVNLDNPKKVYSIVVNKERTDFFVDSYRGAGGLPYGTEGRVLVLIENEKSVKAAILVMKRGCSVTPLFLKIEKPKLLKSIAKIGPIGKSIVAESEDEISDIMKKRRALAVVTNEDIGSLKERAFPVLRPLIGY